MIVFCVSCRCPDVIHESAFIHTFGFCPLVKLLNLSIVYTCYMRCTLCSSSFNAQEAQLNSPPQRTLRHTLAPIASHPTRIPENRLTCIRTIPSYREAWGFIFVLSNLKPCNGNDRNNSNKVTLKKQVLMAG